MIANLWLNIRENPLIQKMTSTIHITSLGAHGEGVGTLPDGRKIFVDGVLPGEEVEISIAVEKKRYAKGTLERIHTPSPERETPICPIFGTCGGCQIMHLAYEGQLKAKRQRVVDALQRIGHLDLPVAACVPSPQPLAYRNKIQLPVRGSTVGLYKRGSHEIVPVEKCYIQCDQGEQLMETVSPWIDHQELRFLILKNGLATQETLVILVVSKLTEAIRILAHKIASQPHVKGVVANLNPRADNVVLTPDFVTLEGRPYIYEELLGLRFRLSVPSFFQVNVPQAAQLYQKAIALADPQPHERVIDAYCGVGALALLSQGNVLGIECVPYAIEDAQENARLNQKSVKFVCGDAEKLLEPADVIYLNPPRKGCSETLLRTADAQRIVYVSCDPATLARDLALLAQRGYRPEEITPFDMFPQTMHVESVVRLTR